MWRLIPCVVVDKGLEVIEIVDTGVDQDRPYE